MTPEELEAWRKWAKESGHRWTVDPIHDGRDGRDLLLFIGGESGKYVRFDNSATLTANRDGLVRPYSSQLSAFVTELAVDKRSALRNQAARYRRYLGERLRRVSRKSLNVGELLDGMDDARTEDVSTFNCDVAPIDGETVKNKNEQWVAKITRDDGRFVCIGADAVALYDSERDFLDGSAMDTISLR